MNILALGASSSSTSINQQLAQLAATRLAAQTNGTVNAVKVGDFPLPLFSEDTEKELGKPQSAQAFFEAIGQADAIVISFAEHNGSYTAAYKNLFDWTSRIDMKVFQGKPLLMLATSPGPGGAQNVLNTAVTSAPYFAGEVKASLSIASFYEHFDLEKGEFRSNEQLDKLDCAIGRFVASL